MTPPRSAIGAPAQGGAASGPAKPVPRRPLEGVVWPWAVLVLLPLAAVVAAVVSQHVYGMLPCPWCILQRLLFVLIALLALPGLMLRVPIVRLASAAAVMLVCIAGLAAALWQHFVAASSTSCAMTLADRINTAVGLDALWPEIFAAYATCADAAVKLFGLPYEAYSGALFFTLFLVALLALRRARTTGPR